MENTRENEEQETITFNEFKTWLLGLIQGKNGALPDLDDWKEIKLMLDKVHVPEAEEKQDYSGDSEIGTDIDEIYEQIMKIIYYNPIDYPQIPTDYGKDLYVDPYKGYYTDTFYTDHSTFYIDHLNYYRSYNDYFAHNYNFTPTMWQSSNTNDQTSTKLYTEKCEIVPQIDDNVGAQSLPTDLYYKDE